MDLTRNEIKHHKNAVKIQRANEIIILFVFIALMVCQFIILQETTHIFVNYILQCVLVSLAIMCLGLIKMRTSKKYNELLQKVINSSKVNIEHSISKP